MNSFWIKVSLVSISIVCSSSYSHLSGYGQFGLYGDHYYGDQYQTDFGKLAVVDEVAEASHQTDDGYDDDGYGGHDDLGHDYDDGYGYYHPHYAYGYSVHGYDPYGGPGPRIDKSETQQGGFTEGGYSVDLPDGRTQIVTYTVRGDEGYVAKVEYVPTHTY